MPEMLVALLLHTSALQTPAAVVTTRRLCTPGSAVPFVPFGATRHVARSAPVVMKRPWYLPEKEEKGDKWAPGDEPSLKGFLAGFMVGLDGGKAKVKQKDYVAEEEEEAEVVEEKKERQTQQEPET